MLLAMDRFHKMDDFPGTKFSSHISSVIVGSALIVMIALQSYRSPFELMRRVRGGYQEDRCLKNGAVLQVVHE